MGRYIKLQLLAVLAMSVVLISGCATTQSTKSGTKDDTQYVGFLSDYSKLKPEADGSDAKIYLKPGHNFKQYNKVYLDRIRVWLKEDSKYKGIDPVEMQTLTDYFQQAIIQELGSAYPLVQKPGPDVLRVRIAVTQLKPTKPQVSVITAIMPYGTGTAADIAMSAATGHKGHPPYLGEASIEAEFLNSETHEQVAAYVEQRLGKKFDVHLEKGAGKAVSEGVASYAKAYSEWGYVKQAFDYWAHKLRVRLDQAHGKKDKM